jgi:hypothetical protein
VEDRIRGPEDDVVSVVTRKELDDVTRHYRRIAGFDVKALNRKAGDAHREQAPA